MNNKIPKNKPFGKLRSPGLSKLKLSLYPLSPDKLYLNFKFNPCTARDYTGRDVYSQDTYISTSINYEGAKEFHSIAKSALDELDSKKEIIASIPCGKDATLTFEYKQEEDGHMGAYLISSKGKITIPFRFQTYREQGRDRSTGDEVTIVIQLDLIHFNSLLDRYIKIVDLEKESNVPKSPTSQTPPAMWNNPQY